jgi:hypothetical protein
VRILVWNDHGGWLDAFIRGRHSYLLPVATDADKERDRWPANVEEVTPGELRERDIDVVVLQRLEEFAQVQQLLDRKAGTGIPAIFVEHNTPQADVPNSRHPLADRDDILIVHVTNFNQLLWDSGSTHTAVINHGIYDRGYSYTGELRRAGAVINEPVRRWRVTGSDLLAPLSAAAPIDVFGMKAHELERKLQLPGRTVVAAGNLSPDELHLELPRRRLYLHPNRWTSLGLSLPEAMHAGMPVVALEATEARRAIPPEAGVVSTDLDELREGMRRFMDDPDAARIAGAHARAFALDHYGLPAYLEHWDWVLSDWCGSRATRGSTALFSQSSR